MQPDGVPNRELVLSELDRILASPAFRTARRSQDLLRYIVSNAVDGKTDHLKERAIGAAVFGRPADYDTGADSIVRVNASELRKRLAQYYQEAGRDAALHIHLPAGSYNPEFRFSSTPPAPIPPPSSRYKWIAVGMGVLALAGVLLWFRPGSPATKLDQFWTPVFRDSRPVVLCVAHPVVYLVSGVPLGPGSEPLPKNLTADLLVRDPDHFVGYGDAFALAQLNGFFRARGKLTDIRVGNDVSFADLRQAPVVLIGAYTNQWTVEMTRDLRFIFDRVGPSAVLRDQHNADQYWRRATGESGDYVLVSRLFDSKSGNTVVTAAGLGHLGTQMAGEFLTQPALFESILKDAPADWPRKNAQWILHGEIIGKTAGPPSVVASYYW